MKNDDAMKKNDNAMKKNDDAMKKREPKRRDVTSKKGAKKDYGMRN